MAHGPGSAGGSSQVSGGGGRDDHDVNDDVMTGGGLENVQVSGTDDLLDEIDGLLENNAEEFVRSYVQKGGQ
ncbi:MULTISPECIES: ubiquitin-like protein Pup [Corynebacterium]|uniref:Prokaryotic ubiquitin-like protein Pup n=1 Tax=Corynebacterium auriscanis TaxID=99807 RepID=A0A0A2DN48_9CORY|nr:MULTISPECIES: ubiquitin-like protein Pup [Corynebacterium]KGM19339.1 ubiquitin [Corynebacterium auriscanis]OFT90326.1 ubiquitin [Corynebacterium sp. HMSC28B08]WJY72674.1 Prokaryotic ubiquitin-like protein Pup [Corynebacterium auriscanis]